MNRREWLAFSGATLSAACRRRRGTGYSGYALVAVSAENSVAVVDLTTFRLIKSVQLGAPPTAVVPGPGGRFSYVLTPSTGSVHILDATLRLSFSKPLAHEISEIRLAAGNKRLMAISSERRELIEADPISLKVLNRHKLASPPLTLDVGISGLVAMSSGVTGVVELFNLANGQHTRTQMPGPIGSVRFRADGRILLVANLHDRSLTALDIPSLQVLADLPLAMQPQNLCFNTDQGQLFVSGEGMDGVAIVFPYNILEVEQTVLAGRDPGFMACSENPDDLFVASQSGSDVCILDIFSRKVIGFVSVGRKPVYIAITPDSQYALVLDQALGQMAVIHIAAIRATRSKSGAGLFTMIPVGENPVHVAVVPRTA